jgi:hypothetical protein
MNPFDSEESVLEGQGLSALEQRQQLLAHHVRMVARKMSHALFVFGSQGGLGKSRTIVRTLDEEGITPILINSHVTALSLYSIFYQHHKDDAVLFFDDVDSMYSSLPHLGLLRSALWNPRIVTYSSSMLPSDLPPSFEFSGRCIFAANTIPAKNDAFKAMLSRADCFDLSASNEEVLDLMRTVSAKGFHGLTIEDCNMVIDYIGDNCDDRQISMRLLGPSLRKLQYARSEGLDWRPLVKSQLQTIGRKQPAAKRLDSKSRDLRLLREALKKFPESVKDQMNYFCQKTSKSRASFYRALARQRDEG